MTINHFFFSIKVILLDYCYSFYARLNYEKRICPEFSYSIHNFMRDTMILAKRIAPKKTILIV